MALRTTRNRTHQACRVNAPERIPPPSLPSTSSTSACVPRGTVGDRDPGRGGEGEPYFDPGRGGEGESYFDPGRSGEGESYFDPGRSGEGESYFDPGRGGEGESYFDPGRGGEGGSYFDPGRSGEEGILLRITDTTRMISTFRSAAMRALVILH